eukprot:m.589783 g.589783  ORF g.589783 m.589783 type:complete len:80 (+) comp58009_c0_seq8:1493-1732(+)
MNMGTYGADVDHYASVFRKAAGIEEVYLQYRYMTEVLGLTDNILVMDVADVWADPEAGELVRVSFCSKNCLFDSTAGPL